jgi:hypothetical protein
MTDTKTLRNNRPNGIGDPERGERLGNQSRPGTSRDARFKGFSALASSGTRSSQTSRHLREYMFGQAPMCNQGDEPKHCEEAAGAAGDSTSDLQRQYGASERKEQRYPRQAYRPDLIGQDQQFGRLVHPSDFLSETKRAETRIAEPRDLLT